MSEALINIVAIPDYPGVSRWQAVEPRGSKAGVASSRPVTPFKHDVVLATAAAMEPGDAELSLYVQPQWRRRGIGSRLLATVRAEATEPRLVTDVAAGAPGAAFWLRHGFQHTRSRRHHLLTYGDVHQAWLGELVDAQHPGYRLTHWTGNLPNTLRIEELLRSPSRPGNALLTAADTDGDLAAYAVAIVDAVSQPRARQYGSVVLPHHRGRRLGLWVNAALIQRMREFHPYINEIETFTAEDDLHLGATCKHLGFHPLGVTHLYELALP